MPAMRTCPTPNCPRLIPRGARRCGPCGQDYEAKRGTPTQRGYDADHRKASRAWKAKVRAGQLVLCWRCGQPITDADDLDLGHDDTDRDVTRGPEHARRCNRANAGRIGARNRNT